MNITGSFGRFLGRLGGSIIEGYLPIRSNLPADLIRGRQARLAAPLFLFQAFPRGQKSISKLGLKN
jgi:hypothetical protein